MRRTAIAHTNSPTSRQITIAILSAFILLTSCQPKSQNPTEAPLTETGQMSETADGQPKTGTDKPNSEVASTRANKITFRNPDGTPEFSLQLKSTGGKLLDGSGAVITNLILQKDGAIKLTDANYNIVGYISRTDSAIHIEGPKRTKTLFSFATSADGNALLTRNDGSTVYRLDTTDSGYMVASDKAALYAVRSQKGKGQMQTTDGQVVIGTDSAIAPAALATFGFDKLTQAQQAGLAYTLSTQPI